MLDAATPFASETMAQRHGRMLARLAELSLAAAEDLAARAAQAEEPKLAAELHMAFAKAGRCLRQTVMLEARLAKVEADRPARAAAPEPVPAPASKTSGPGVQRHNLLAEVLESEIMEQLEGEERETRLDDLFKILDQEGQRPGFLKELIQAQVLRLCDRLDLTFGARPTSPPPPEPKPARKAQASDYAYLDTGRWRGSG